MEHERLLTRGVRACLICVWLNRYEQGHGLVDAVQFQKKLKNDLHRLEAELERRSLKASREKTRGQLQVAERIEITRREL